MEWESLNSYQFTWQKSAWLLGYGLQYLDNFHCYFQTGCLPFSCSLLWQHQQSTFSCIPMESEVRGLTGVNQTTLQVENFIAKGFLLRKNMTRADKLGARTVSTPNLQLNVQIFPWLIPITITTVPALSKWNKWEFILFGKYSLMCTQLLNEMNSSQTADHR